MSTNRSPSRKDFEFRLDLQSGVPVYRQIIDQVMGGMAAGTLAGGHQLPTVRQVAVDLSINPNTVVRAYRELEIRKAPSNPHCFSRAGEREPTEPTHSLEQ